MDLCDSSFDFSFILHAGKQFDPASVRRRDFGNQQLAEDVGIQSQHELTISKCQRKSHEDSTNLSSPFDGSPAGRRNHEGASFKSSLSQAQDKARTSGLLIERWEREGQKDQPWCSVLAAEKGIVPRKKNKKQKKDCKGSYAHKFTLTIPLRY